MEVDYLNSLYSDDYPKKFICREVNHITYLLDIYYMLSNEYYYLTLSKRNDNTTYYHLESSSLYD